jgi:hypothetical protein
MFFAFFAYPEYSGLRLLRLMDFDFFNTLVQIIVINSITHLLMLEKSLN